VVVVRRVWICGSVLCVSEGRWKWSSRSGAFRIVGRWDFDCMDLLDNHIQRWQLLNNALIFTLRRSEPLLNHSLFDCFLQSSSNLGHYGDVRHLLIPRGCRCAATSLPSNRNSICPFIPVEMCTLLLCFWSAFYCFCWRRCNWYVMFDWVCATLFIVTVTHTCMFHSRDHLPYSTTSSNRPRDHLSSSFNSRHTHTGASSRFARLVGL